MLIPDLLKFYLKNALTIYEIVPTPTYFFYFIFCGQVNIKQQFKTTLGVHAH